MSLLRHWIIRFSSKPKNSRHFKVVTSVNFEITATAIDVKCKYLWLVLATRSQAPLILLCFVAYIHKGRRNADSHSEMDENKVTFSQSSSSMPEFYPQSPWVCRFQLGTPSLQGEIRGIWTDSRKTWPKCGVFNKSCPEVFRQKVGMGLGVGVKINKLSAPWGQRLYPVLSRSRRVMELS